MVLPRHALYYACLGDAFDGKEAARIGMVNFAVPPEKLEDATTELAEKLMKKSAAVLRATKQAIRHVRTMDVAQAYDYLAEKGKAIKVADKEDSYNTGLRQFLDEKSYKPTFEPFRLGTMLTDQTAETGGQEIMSTPTGSDTTCGSAPRGTLPQALKSGSPTARNGIARADEPNAKDLARCREDIHDPKIAGHRRPGRACGRRRAATARLPNSTRARPSP